ncbi:MAG TPA: LysR family transcriptional regulator [Pseudonocardiaceae bacterium]
MSQERVQVRQLEYFVALAQERNFARAAAACFVSQPALSEAIRKLEHELGVLLVRRGNAFEGLTSEGERVIVWARRILADHDALRQEIMAMHSGLSGTLRLGVIAEATTTAQLLIEPFVVAHPLTRVRMETRLPTREILSKISQFELDAGIVHIDSDDVPPGFEVVPLYREKYVLIASRSLVPNYETEISWAEAAELPMCMFSGAMFSRRIINDALEAHNVHFTPQIETDSMASIYSLALTGRWASIVPHPWMHAFAHRLDLRTLIVCDPIVSTGVALVTLSGHPGGIMANALNDIARQLTLEVRFAQLLPGNDLLSV